ncbi:hypothetical protein QJS10_CPA01g01924 [Acorus calamus]|uniref:DUF1639 family protein n=1 Tax=Acorus calamus TaxID=4465 RepID=A0AAV9FRQ8_ACOCL|nr:hypothetical protein QJS10_CPA01g01924 [Acorus calamus]
MKDCRNPLIYRCQRVSPDYIPMTNGRKSNPRTFKDDDPDSARIPSYGATGDGNIESKPLRIRSAWTHQSPNPDTTSTSVVVLLPPQSERDHRSPSKNPINENGAPPTIGGGDVLLQWGHKKRSRGARVENRTAADEASARQAARIHRRSAAAAASSGLSEKSAAAVSMPPPPCSAATTSYSRGENLRPSMPRWGPSPPMGRTMEDRISRGGAPRSTADNKRSSPPSPPEKAVAGEKMDNGSTAAHADLSRPSDREAVGAPVPEKLNMELFEWPRIYISLSRKEKEDDFFVMKGAKLPQRPKKRAKNIDKALQYCFPGMWLSELTRGRYEVREKKCVKKQKRRGLKGLESMDSDSD